MAGTASYEPYQAVALCVVLQLGALLAANQISDAGIFTSSFLSSDAAAAVNVRCVLQHCIYLANLGTPLCKTNACKHNVA